jgi:hypothetical protein
MKKIQTSFLSIFLLLFSSCLEHDLTTLSPTINAELGLAIPLIHSTTTLGDLLPDNEDLYTDEDGLIRIYFRQDSIAHVASDSLLSVENQEPTIQEFTVGSISLSDFTSNVVIEMSSLTSNLQDSELSDQITEAINYSQTFGSAYFPPINPQSGGNYNTQGSTEFQSVLISEGVLNIEITNNFAIDLSELELRLSNSIDNTEIGVFLFQNILASNSELASVQLQNINLSAEMSIEIVNLSSPGSGSDPLDQSSWLTISNEDELVIAIETADLIATQGFVKFPEQTGPDSTFVIDMDFDEGVEIELIDLSAGAFVYSYESDLNTVLELLLEIPQLVDVNSNPFSEIIQIENSGLVTNSISLEGYSFVFSGTSNQLQVNYSSQIVPTENFVSYNQLDEITLSIGMEDLDFELIQGYFGQLDQSIEEDILDLDFSALTDIATGIVLENPSLVFTTDNSIGIPFEIDLNLIGEANGVSVTLGGPSLVVPAEQISNTDFNNSNSQLQELIALNPTIISYSGSVISNPLGNEVVLNTLRPNTGINIGFEMDLPLHLRIQDAVTKDTLALSLDSENITQFEMVESVRMQLYTENEFPLDVALTMLFQDSITGVVFDSLKIELLEAASVDENGRSIEPRVYNSNISLNSGQFDALFNANQTILDIRMKSYDVENTAIKLYTDYEFIIDAGVIIELKIEE